MQPPSLASYEATARSIYQPQMAAEKNSIIANDKMTKTSLEAEKGQVNTDYQSAVDKLTQNVQDQSAKISQLYSERLGGNFSGLQGNDMGQMFARTNEAQSIIEQTRANRLATITAGETNADIKMNADLASLAPKYQGLQADYAAKAYSAAYKDYETQMYRQANLNLREQSLAETAAYHNATLSQNANKPLSMQDTAAAIRSGLEKVKGGDNHVSPGNLAKAYALWTGQGLAPKDFWKYYQGYWNPKEGNYGQLFNAALRSFRG